MIGRFAEGAMEFPWIFAITWFFFRLFSDKARNPGLLFQSIEKNIDQHTVLGNS